ncbi:MAG: GntR family transcriptional regulator [Candidatus Heteroscillospira sp.]
MREKIVEAVPLREQVANIIRKMIITGELQAGSPISERQISQSLGVSTTPVKEAFRILESEGLMYAIARKGSFISSFPKKNMLQIVFMRSSLEGVAAYFAALNADEADIAEMEEALACSGRIVAEDVLSTEIAVHNEIFHDCLRSSSKNEYLVSLIRNMRSVDSAVRTVAATSDHEEPPRAQKEHLAILDAIKQRDSARAEQLMVAHVRRVGEFVLD